MNEINFEGDLIITSESDKEWLNELKSVSGWVKILCNAQLPVLQSVGGYLDIRADAQLPVLQSVGGHLGINHDAQLPVLQSVGSHLDIRADAQLPVLQSVGGYLYINHDAKFIKPDTLKNNWGKNNGDTYANVVYADKMYTPYKNIREIKNQEKEITVYSSLCLGAFWTVTDGKYWSHGKTLRQAITDLNFKYLKQNKNKLKTLDRNKSYKVEEIINFYRIITGACLAGCEQFVNSNCSKKEYTLKEAIEIVKNNNAYENDKFIEFFEVENDN